MMFISKFTFYLICVSYVLFGLSGCSGSVLSVSVAPPNLTKDEKVLVGEAVEQKLTQLLGGPYHDKKLARDLDSLLRNPGPFKIVVADQSSEAFYPLPGDRVILTRGLLSKVRNRVELESFLLRAVSLSEVFYSNNVTRSMRVTTEEVLSGGAVPLDPDSAVIRLARIFEQEACGRVCLDEMKNDGSIDHRVDSSGLSESIKSLSKLAPGYDLLAEAKEFENADDHAKAIATYLQAAAITPDEPRLLGSLGFAYLRAGDLQSARLHLKKAVKFQPDYYRTRMGLGYLFLQLGQLSKADRHLTESVRLLPVTENLFLLARVREDDGKKEKAMMLYRLIVESDQYSKLGSASVARLIELAGEE